MMIYIKSLKPRQKIDNVSEFFLNLLNKQHYIYKKMLIQLLPNLSDEQTHNQPKKEYNAKFPKNVSYFIDLMKKEIAAFSNLESNLHEMEYFKINF